MLQQQRTSANPATIEGIADKLAPHPLFARLNRDAQLCIAQRCEIVCYPAGTVLMRQGETGSFACVVLEGEIDIFVEIPAGPIPMATVGRNHMVGELGLFTGTPRTATAVARTDAVAIRIVLHPGDALFLFTDGITEALDLAGDEFGTGRLETALEAARGHSAAELGSCPRAWCKSGGGFALSGGFSRC